MGAAHTPTATAPRQPMAALARGLGAACRISVARLRPAESDVRSMSSTRSKTVGAVRQVRGGAEAGFWVVCWVPRGGVRQLAAAGSGGGEKIGLHAHTCTRTRRLPRATNSTIRLIDHLLDFSMPPRQFMSQNSRRSRREGTENLIRVFGGRN